MASDKELVLSVLMPVYNAEKELANAIESILDQSFIDFELIIADDGSKDNSKEIIDSYAEQDKRIIVSHNDINLGKVLTVNKLYEKAKGRYITIHDADDISDSERFDKQLKVLEGSEIDFCGTNFLTISKTFSSLSNLETEPIKLRTRLERESQIHGPTLIFRRSILQGEVYRKFFDGYGEDYDLILRLLNQGTPSNLEECLYSYNKGKGSLSISLTPKKLFSHELAQELYRQRTSRESDWLMEGNYNELNARLNFLTKEYREDESLIYQRQAELYMYYGYKWQAILESIKAIYIKPTKLSNFRLLQYCLRKKILGW